MSRDRDPQPRKAQAPATAASRSSRRWPAALGIATVLAVAVAIGWQRPGPEIALPDEAIGTLPVSAVEAGPGPDTAAHAAAAPVIGPTPASLPVSVTPSETGPGTVSGHHGLDDLPPATVDSPQARAAWLDRVRELRDAGEQHSARASLGEYQRRYPDQALPDDLNGLLSE